MPSVAFGDVYRGRTVLVTGHTGFKGSWLCLWLTELGAKVVGYALPPHTRPSHYAHLDLGMSSIEGDVRDDVGLVKVLESYQPQVVFHLAAQSLVRRSYREPAETYETNVVGTLNVLEASRRATSVQAIVVVTSDKVYENRESVVGYIESDPLGGHDPYSSSKACADILTSSYRRSFFPVETFGTKHRTLVATARAGNVIGGGDWAEDRILPDTARATAARDAVLLRNPRAVRPWQHVLDPLAGYLLLGQGLLNGRTELAEAWNFGPEDESCVAVETLISEFRNAWEKVQYNAVAAEHGPHETKVLKLNSAKARRLLCWRPIWGFSAAVQRTAAWYRDFYERDRVASRDDLSRYIADAAEADCAWQVG